MLQVSQNQHSSQLINSEAEAGLAGSSDLFGTSIGFLRRQIWILVIPTIVATCLGVALFFTIVPNYVASALMLIDTSHFNFFQHPTMGEASFETTPALESQMEILKSENVALTVIRQLHLTDDPEFTGDESSPARGSRFGILSSLFGSGAPLSEQERTKNALDSFEKRLKTTRIGISYVIEINFQSNNSERAAQVANAVADAYVAEQLEGRYQAVRRASGWLEDRVKELREQSSAAQRAVVEFRAKNNLVESDKGRSANEQQISEINSRLVIAREQASEAKARFDRVNEIVLADSPEATVNPTVADLLNNQLVTRLRTQYLEIANRERDWSEKYGRNHLAAVNLRNQMREIQSAILDELRRVGESYKSEYEIATQRKRALEKELAQVVSSSNNANNAQVTLRELETSAQTLKALYDNYVQRYTETVEQQSVPVNEARLITKASAPQHRNYKKTLLICALTPFFGLAFGLGLGVLREVADRVYRTTNQVENNLKVNCIGLVPLLKGHEVPQATSEEQPVRAPKTIARTSDVFWTVIDEPFSRFSEAIRSIKVSSDLSGLVKSSRIIGMTSAIPGEGKTTVAAALALTIAQGGSRVILVDCDLRNPSLTRALAPQADAGILDVISDKVSLEEATWKEPSTNLEFLPGANKRRLAHSSEILSCEAMKRLFEKMRLTYDYIVVDLSPVAPVVDVRATTRLIESYVLVVEWGKTRIDVVERALSEAQGIYDNVVGVVLNKVDMARLGRYVGDGAKYYGYDNYYHYGDET